MLSFEGYLAVSCAAKRKHSAEVYAWLSESNSVTRDLVGDATSWRCKRNVGKFWYMPSIDDTNWSIPTTVNKKNNNTNVPRSVAGMVMMIDNYSAKRFINCRKFVTCKENSNQSLFLSYNNFLAKFVCCR